MPSAGPREYARSFSSATLEYGVQSQLVRAQATDIPAPPTTERKKSPMTQRRVVLTTPPPVEERPARSSLKKGSRDLHSLSTFMFRVSNSLGMTIALLKSWLTVSEVLLVS